MEILIHIKLSISALMDSARMFLESHHDTRYLRVKSLWLFTKEGGSLQEQVLRFQSPCYTANVKQRLWLLNLTHCDTWR